jgi:hypothetical protein
MSKQMNTETWLLAALLAGVSMPAHADEYLNCSGFNQTFGYAGVNPPVTARVTHSDYGRWAVTYYLLNGEVVFRENQYVMSDESDRTKTQWSGWHGNKHMVGMLMNDNSNHHIAYMEYLYDINNKLLSSNWIDCGNDHSAPPPQRPAYEASVPPSYVTPPATTPTSSGLEIVLTSDGRGGHTIDVTLGTGTPVTMLLDTGATMVSVPKDIADQLISIGEAVVITQGQFTIADATTNTKILLTLANSQSVVKQYIM